MRVLKQSESALPERAPGVHEYRAALFSVFLHTSVRGELSELLTPDKQPLPLPSALALIDELPPEHYEPARDVAGCKLAFAVLIEHKQEFEPYLAEFLGISAQELTERLRRTLPQQPSDRPLSFSYDQLRQVFYGGEAPEIRAAFRTRPSSPAPAPTTQAPPPESSKPGPGPGKEALKGLKKITQKLITRDEPVSLGTCFDEEALQQLPPSPQSTLNLSSLVTTVDIPSKSYCSFDFLARALDPRSWSRSPFWPASYQVERSKDGLSFSEATGTTSQRGESWKGYLFEHVEFNWNLANIAAFKNYLDIRYEVDPEKQQLRLDFALYSCEGSQFSALQYPKRGIEVDCGFQCVAPLPASAGQEDAPFRIRTVKNIRYADFLDRSTPDQGPVGAGQALRYVAPAVVGLWMNELIRRLYCLPAAPP
ncbi:MAG: hypothetical protein ACJ8AT_11485 [Hyalangium sp.]|uniref:hypothetical protein n=1 Tax=Hyalangium sp. TaxID=2028555 RepID=UPI003899E3B8